MDNKNKIDLTKSKRPDTSEIKVTDEYNSDRFFPITGELPLTIYLDKKEIVTLMTLGHYPIGWKIYRWRSAAWTLLRCWIVRRTRTWPWFLKN